MRILVTGKRGQLVTALRKTCQSEKDVRLICLGRPECDFEQPQTVFEAIVSRKPDIVINAAAWTAVDAAEQDPRRAYTVNALGAEAVARAAAVCGAPMLQISTDYVFSGNQNAPYTELDAPDPINVYGASKLEGEQRVAAGNPRHLILRTSWIYSATGQNFLTKMLKLAGEVDELNIVSDQTGSPTYAGGLANALMALIRHILSSDKAEGMPVYGVFHLSNSGATSWHGFAAEIFAASNRLAGPVAKCQPISTTEYPTTARRPLFSVLDCARISHIYGISLPHWTRSVQHTVQKKLAGRSSDRL